MVSPAFFHAFLVVMVVLAGTFAFTLTKRPAGYGQYTNRPWGATINDRAGWVIM